jgi:RNA-binding protein NOB1
VADFAKKTGDFYSLSATDLKVIALAYMLEKDIHGLERIRTEPVSSQTKRKVVG